MTVNNLKNLQNKKIAMLGLGVENLALVKFLLRRSPAAGQKAGKLASLPRGEFNITICDPKSAAELGDRFLEIKLLARKNKLPEINLMSGIDYDAHLADFDIIFRSPGYPLFNPNIVKAKKAGVEISSAMELFFELCPTKNIVGVTGSKGKGTTSSLIFEIIKASLVMKNTPRPSATPLDRGRVNKVFLGGNIGTAPFDFIEKIKPNNFVVLELSSFQLEDLQVSPKIAVITNLFKEHLAPADPSNPNYHQSMKDYWAAKANIFTHQKKTDYLVVNEDLQIKDYGLRTPAKIIVYGKSELPSNLTGEHNKENIAAAVAVAKILKIKNDVIAKAVRKFQGLPHRLELVAEINGVKYFDDSFATVPDVSVIALKAIGSANKAFCPSQPTLSARRVNLLWEGNIILLAGGADKGSDFKNFAKEIKKSVKYLILFKGKGSERLKKELQKTKYQILNTKEVDNMKDAVKIAKSKAKSRDIVLLSTGCASFGCFKNYKERGDQFKNEVLK
jgi:UDP-N-acetylmuramoylalanine--D-glutamate ligase